eukprot:5536539-Prymnesium_polylepis.1
MADGERRRRPDICRENQKRALEAACWPLPRPRLSAARHRPCGQEPCQGLFPVPHGPRPGGMILQVQDRWAPHTLCLGTRYKPGHTATHAMRSTRQPAHPMHG